jgi:hypothetical protein
MSTRFSTAFTSHLGDHRVEIRAFQEGVEVDAAQQGVQVDAGGQLVNVQRADHEIDDALGDLLGQLLGRVGHAPAYRA